MSARLDAENLTVAYPLPHGHHLAAVGPVSLTIGPGEFVSLVGPSGCGKSTLMRVLAGLLPPTRGQAFVDHQVVRAPSRQVAIMFQDANLMPWRTVLDNIGLPLELAGVGRSERESIVHALLPRLGLSEFADAYPGELSGGMAQRTALGRVLIQRPSVLLLDEPFGALDAMTREQVSLDLLALWHQEHPTILMVTHDIHEAVLLSDRVLVMSHRPGRFIADIVVPLARPRALADSYDEAFARVAREVRAAIERA